MEREQISPEEAAAVAGLPDGDATGGGDFKDKPDVKKMKQVFRKHICVLDFGLRLA